MKKAFEDLKTYLQRKINERDGLLLFKGIPNINERQSHILKILTDKPNSIFTTKEIATRFGVTIKTARTDLQNLIKRGFMVETPINKRIVGYSRSDDFEHEIIKQNKK